MDEWLETPRFRFRVIHTPGHSADHIALYEPNRRWLFSGDLYLAPRLRYLRAVLRMHRYLTSAMSLTHYRRPESSRTS